MEKRNKKKINFKQILPYIIRVFASSILIAIIIYYMVTDGNEAIVNLLNNIKENNNASEFIKILFPILLIICSMTELGKYVAIISKNKEKNDETKKKARNKV